MERLAHAHELLDGPLDAATLEGNLRDLARVNQWLGGARLSVSLIAEAVDFGTADAVRILDIGTGGADIPLAILASWPAEPSPSIVATDVRPEVLVAARTIHPALDRTPEIALEVVDGRTLPYPDGSFDIAHTSLVLHHLEPDEAVELLREMRRVAGAVVVNDLNRTRLDWLGAWLISHGLTRNHYTRNDAALSVRRAYTVREMAAMLREAGLRPVRLRRGFLGHRYGILAVAADAPR